MRRTTICLAIVAVCLGGSAWAQDFMPEQPGFPAEPVAPVAVPDVGAPGQPGGMQQVPGLQPAAAVPSPSQPPQNWQPMETITPIPDVTASGEPIPPGQMLVPGPMMQAAPHGPCCEKTAKGYCCPPNWYLDQRVRVMHHPKPRGTIVGGYGGIGQAFNGLQFVDVFTFRPGISTRTVPFEPAAGYEFTLGRYLGRDSDNRDQFVEFTYYGMNHWDQDYAIHQTDRPRATRNGEGNLFPNADNLSDVQRETFGNLFGVFDSRLAGFNRVDDMAERYASRFDNFELNMRIRPRMRHDRMVLYQSGRWQREAQDGMVFSFLGGLRGLSLDESYLLTGSGQISVEDFTDPDNPTTTTATTTGRYDVRTHNDMVGLQIGCDGVYRKDFLELGVRGKAGVFINFADQLSTVLSTGGLGDPMGDVELYDANGPYTDVNDQYYEERIARSRDAAGLVEVGFTAGYQVRSNMVVRAAFDMMWLNGVALAPEQVDGQIGAPGRINRNGLQFMQSLSLGVELDW